jgi:hypothetical protein
MSIFEIEQHSPLQLDDGNTQKIHRLCNYNDLNIQFLGIQYISFNNVYYYNPHQFLCEHLGIRSTSENPVLPVHRMPSRWGNNIVRHRDWTGSPTQSGPPHHSDHPHLWAWLNRTTTVGSMKLTSSLASPPSIRLVLHGIRSSSPEASLDLSVVGHWVWMMWLRETLGWGGGGSELPLMLDHDGDIEMARPCTDVITVEGHDG